MKAGLVFMLAAALGVSGALAQPGWETIGSRAVGRDSDRDVISVRGHERYRQVRLCVAGGSVRLFDLDLRFANGSRQDARVRNVIGPVGCTRAIDLVGNQRDLTEIRLVYERLRRRTRPVLTVEAR